MPYSNFSVTIVDEESPDPATQTTADIDEALDWFTNAVTEVLEGDSEVVFASITVDGVLWGEVREGGLARGDDGGGEVVPLRRTKAA